MQASEGDRDAALRSARGSCQVGALRLLSMLFRRWLGDGVRALLRYWLLQKQADGFTYARASSAGQGAGDEADLVPITVIIMINYHIWT